MRKEKREDSLKDVKIKKKQKKNKTTNRKKEKRE